jgi:hypothetical protein
MSNSSAATKRWREKHPEKYLENKRAYYERNKEKISEQRKAERKSNPGKAPKGCPIVRKNTFYKSRYGITLEEYNQKLEKQQEVCAICHCPETTKTKKGAISALAVDHDHTTGEIRGLLCRTCNTALGKFRDSLIILERGC